MQKDSQCSGSKTCRGRCLTEDPVAEGKSLLQSFTKASEFLGTGILLPHKWHQGQPENTWKYPLRARGGHVCGNRTIPLGPARYASFVLEAVS